MLKFVLLEIIFTGGEFQTNLYKIIVFYMKGKNFCKTNAFFMIIFSHGKALTYFPAGNNFHDYCLPYPKK